MKCKSRMLALLSAAVLTVSYLPAVPKAAAASALLCEPYSVNNIGAHDYSRFTSVIQSAMLPSGDGWMIVQGGASEGNALIDYYDADFHLADRKLIPLQLPLWADSMPHRTVIIISSAAKIILRRTILSKS